MGQERFGVVRQGVAESGHVRMGGVWQDVARSGDALTEQSWSCGSIPLLLV